MVDGVCTPPQTPPHRRGRGFKALYGSDFSSNTAEIVFPLFSVVLPSSFPIFILEQKFIKVKRFANNLFYQNGRGSHFQDSRDKSRPYNFFVYFRSCVQCNIAVKRLPMSDYRVCSAEMGDEVIFK